MKVNSSFFILICIITIGQQLNIINEKTFQLSTISAYVFHSQDLCVLYTVKM